MAGKGPPMQLLQLQEKNQTEFTAAPEIAMDFQLGRSNRNDFYLVIGCRVGILLNESTFAEPASDYLGQRWLSSGISADARGNRFPGMAKGATRSAAVDDSNSGAGLAIILERYEPGESHRPVSSSCPAPAFDLWSPSIYHHNLAGDRHLPLGGLPNEQKN